MRLFFSYVMMVIVLISMGVACKSPEPSVAASAGSASSPTQEPAVLEKPEQEPAHDKQACATLVTAFTKETDTTYYMIVDPCWPKSMSTTSVRETYYKPFQLRVEVASGKPWQKIVALSSNYKGRDALDAHVQGMKGTNVEIKLEDEDK